MIWIKWLHVLVAFASVSGFVVRVILSYTAPQILSKPWVRIAPHINDTVLLLAGLTLAFNLPNAFSQPWLLTKIIALVCYIGFGVMAMRATGQRKVIGILGALASVVYIFWIAYTRQTGF